MKILIALACPYLPSLGGAVKVTRTIAAQLARSGHSVRVLALARAAVHRGSTRDGFLAHLASNGLPHTLAEDGSILLRHEGVEVRAFDGSFAIAPALADEIRRFDPTWVVVQTDDWRGMLLSAALDAAGDRVIYFPHTTVQLPVGPDAVEPLSSGGELLRRLARIVVPSRYLGDYLARWAGVASHLAYPPAELFGSPPFPRYGHPDGAILMINPSTLKGLPIFLELARRRPDLPFAVVPGWGTTAADRSALAAVPNIELLAPSSRVDDFYSRARLLFVPSLWSEVFGIVAVEAMLRGIPVVMSDSGGLPEAALDAGIVVPVRKIDRYRWREGVPVAAGECPDQDLAPWLAALERALDPVAHAQLAARSRQQAERWLAEHPVARLERFLIDEAANVSRRPTGTPPASARRSSPS